MPTDPADCLPDDVVLANLMAPWRGARARVIELNDRQGRPLGNHGDWVLHQVFHRLLHAYGIQLVDESMAPPDLLIVPPSGSLLDIYQWPLILRERLARQPDVPLVIFPSSSYFKKTDPTLMFGTRRSPCTWVLRESYSYDHLHEDWGEALGNAGVTLVLDHDVVVSGHRFVPELFAEHTQRPGTGLLVSRLDVEAGSLPSETATPSLARRALVNAYVRVPSDRLRIAVRRRVTRATQEAANAKMLDSVGEFIAQRLSLLPPSGSDFDISDPSLATLKQYISAIANATLVITNRLHVALPSAILGKETYLVTSGYHKLVGVYERSLVELPNITLVSR